MFTQIYLLNDMKKSVIHLVSKNCVDKCDRMILIRTNVLVAVTSLFIKFSILHFGGDSRLIQRRDFFRCNLLQFISDLESSKNAAITKPTEYRKNEECCSRQVIV